MHQHRSKLHFLLFVLQGCATEQLLKKLDQEGLKEAVKQGLVYFEREERDLHMLLFPEVLDQVIIIFVVRVHVPGMPRIESFSAAVVGVPSVSICMTDRLITSDVLFLLLLV